VLAFASFVRTIAAMSIEPADRSPPARPTSVRFLIIGLCVAMSVLLYLDRFALGPVTTTMLEELSLDEEQFGRAVGAFFFAYALMQIPSGWLSDTFGARWTLALYVVLWSLATIGLGLVQGLLAITLMRVMLGITQAGAYPAAASLVKRWIPYAGRGRANSSVSMGGRAGGLLAFFCTPLLMLLVGQWTGWEIGRWRVVFALYGSLGLVWAVAFVWLYRDRPAEHPACNAAERELIAGQTESRPARRRFDLPILAMLASKEVWLMCIIGFCVNIGWIFLVSWLPHYLVIKYGDYVTAHIGPQHVVVNVFTAATGLAGMCGSLLGGTATDILVRRFGPIWGRRLPGLCSGGIVAAIYVVAPQLPGVWLFVAAMIAVSFTIDFGLGATWATYQDIGGRHVAAVLGFGNMCGNLGAAYFSWKIGQLAKGGEWNTVFLMSAGAMLIAASAWLLLDATRPVVREEAS